MRTPVISLYPPWANWVALGWKTIETRTHDRLKSLTGKRIGIHASFKWDASALNAASDFLSYGRWIASRDFLKIGGAIICTAFVKKAGWLTVKDSPYALIDCEHTKRFGLFLCEVNPIPIIPCNGKQGIWYHDIPEDL